PSSAATTPAGAAPARSTSAATGPELATVPAFGCSPERAFVIHRSTSRSLRKHPPRVGRRLPKSWASCTNRTNSCSQQDKSPSIQTPSKELGWRQHRKAGHHWFRPAPYIGELREAADRSQS